MTHDELVERVARAMFPTAWADNNDPDYDAPLGQKYARFKARAALAAVYEAIKEPTSDQVVAGQEVFLDNGYSHAELNDTTLRKAFTAMLEASPLNPEGT
jgi:hypothetical protein